MANLASATAAATTPDRAASFGIACVGRDRASSARAPRAQRQVISVPWYRAHAGLGRIVAWGTTARSPRTTTSPAALRHHHTHPRERRGIEHDHPT